VSDATKQAPIVNGTQVVAAGIASASAAFLTSRFGVAGTLLGAAVTTMIITGGSAILRSYLESVSGSVRKAPSKLHERRNRWKAGRSAEPPETLPQRPDLRDNFAGRMRAALGWFSHLPPLARRSILIKGLIAAAVAFVIGMGAVWGVEKVINNSLSCGFWANCPQGADPGIHLGDRDGAGAGSTLSLGRARTQVAPRYEARDPSYRQNGVQQNGVQQNGVQQNGVQQNGVQQDGVQQNRSYQQGSPDYRQPAPRDSGAQPGGGLLEPDQPAGPKNPVQPETPSSASPAPVEPAPGGVEGPKRDIRPQNASPAPAQ
jgi:hypothetical protein